MYDVVNYVTQSQQYEHVTLCFISFDPDQTPIVHDHDV